MILLTLFLVHCKEATKNEKAATVNEQEPLHAILKEGKLEAYDEAFWNLVSKNTRIEVIAENHEWTEGPLWIEHDSMLLYTDIPRNAVYFWKAPSHTAVYLKPSGFLGADFSGAEPGANGLLLDSMGMLVLCQHGERQIAKMASKIDNPSPEFITIASTYQGHRFNSPNDAVYHSKGALYFTDPPYGLPKQMEDPEKELNFQGVYKLEPDGQVTLLTRSLSRPNGIAFSPDEKTLYVANSDPERAIWMAYDLDENGLLLNERLFYDATQLVATEKGLPDGLKIDAQGHLFATGPGGVLVFSPQGALLGRIHTGQATSNCAFNSDKSILFITADSYVLKVALKG